MSDAVFENCESLRSLWIPAGVRTMSGLTLVSVAVVDIDEENPVFCFDGDFVVNGEDNSLVLYVGRDDEVLIENRCSGIGAGCFRDLADIWAIEFESGCQISFLGERAFSGCLSLDAICIPSSVTRIGKGCVVRCESLVTVTFESGTRLSILSNIAFLGCSSLASICIPSSVTEIGAECFANCSNLATVTAESGSWISVIGPEAFSNCSPSLRLPSSLVDNRLKRFVRTAFTSPCQVF
jgi:hypothetical protein